MVKHIYRSVQTFNFYSHRMKNPPSRTHCRSSWIPPRRMIELRSWWIHHSSLTRRVNTENCPCSSSRLLPRIHSQIYSSSQGFARKERIQISFRINTYVRQVLLLVTTVIDTVGVCTNFSLVPSDPISQEYPLTRANICKYQYTKSYVTHCEILLQWGHRYRDLISRFPPR